MKEPKEIIRLTGMEIHFYLDTNDTASQFTMFKCVIGPGAKMGVPHYHESFDEAIYGLKGTLSYMLNGKSLELEAGDCLFIPRSAVHSFINNGTVPAEFLTVITPGLLGPSYFREIAAVLSAGGPPDVNKLQQIMQRHGLIPVMQPAAY